MYWRHGISPPSFIIYHDVSPLTTNRLIKTSMLKDPSRLGDIDFAEVEDATKALLHVVSDADTTGSYYVQSSPVHSRYPPVYMNQPHD